MVGIDVLGTVSQGVVTYNIKISFDENADNIRPNMSISSEIITQKSEGVLVVSNEALKSKNDVYRVQKVNEKIFSKNLENVMLKEIPRSVVVVIGCLEGNENTEIKTGLQKEILWF